MGELALPRGHAADASIEETLGAGRNCTVFEELRHIAYREVRAFKRDGSLDTFRARLERVATGINMQFPVALRINEVCGIAKSVAKWTWRHFSEEAFSHRQSLRGERRAEQMWAGHVAAPIAPVQSAPPKAATPDQPNDGLLDARGRLP